MSLGRLSFLSRESLGKDIVDTIDAVNLPVGGFLCWDFMRHQSLLQRAIAGWLGVTCAAGFLCFVLLTVVVPMSFVQGSPNGWPALVRARAWMPGPEYIPSLTLHR